MTRQQTRDFAAVLLASRADAVSVLADARAALAALRGEDDNDAQDSVVSACRAVYAIDIALWRLDPRTYSAP